MLNKHCQREVWPTSTGRLSSIGELLEIDEYEFFGNNYQDDELRMDIGKLRARNLPERALALTTRALKDETSHTKWVFRCDDFVKQDPVSHKKGADFFNKLREIIIKYARDAGADGITSEDVLIDIPEPPKYDRLGQETLIQIVGDYVVQLKDLFPFQKVVNNYSTQYKYRSYVFSSECWKSYVAYAAFRGFIENGIHLNDLALILAHQEGGLTRDLLNKNNIAIPDWRDKSNFYVPDAI